MDKIKILENKEKDFETKKTKNLLINLKDLERNHINKFLKKIALLKNLMRKIVTF